MKVEVPNGVPNGPEQVGIGVSRKADIQVENGTRYVEVPDHSMARTLMRRWAEVHDVSYTDDGRVSGGSWDEDTGNISGGTSVDEAVDTHWQTVVSAVREGVFDDKLDELAEQDTRNSVHDAIDERRLEVSP